MLDRPCYKTTTDCMTESMDLGTWIEVSNEVSQGAKTTFSQSFTSVLKPADFFFYRVCPKNGVGFGACSEEYSFMSD